MPTYRERLGAALAELAEKDVAPLAARPPFYRLLRALGLPLRPPLYQGLLPLVAYHTLAVAPLVGAAFWFLIWRHDAVALQRLISPTLQIAVLPGVLLALLTRFRAWRLKRTPWHKLADGARPIADASADAPADPSADSDEPRS